MFALIKIDSKSLPMSDPFSTLPESADLMAAFFSLISCYSQPPPQRLELSTHHTDPVRDGFGRVDHSCPPGRLMSGEDLVNAAATHDKPRSRDQCLDNSYGRDPLSGREHFSISLCELILRFA